MRQTCYEIYKNYIENDRHIVHGLIEGLELVVKGKRAKPAGVHCFAQDDPEKTCNFE